MNVPISSSSPTEAMLRTVDRRDKLMRAVELVILAALVVFNIFTVFRLQEIINQNQTSTLNARELNINRQAQMERYIKCILLLRYDNPELTAQSPREEVEMALDKCAQKVSE